MLAGSRNSAAKAKIFHFQRHTNVRRGIAKHENVIDLGIFCICNKRNKILIVRYCIFYKACKKDSRNV